MILRRPSRVVCHSAIYGVAVAFMVLSFFNHNLPIYGFRWLPDFGAAFEHQMSKDFMTKSGYVLGSKYGYDGQFYAQLAIDPLLRNPETANGLDNFEFRARRPLFAMTAWAAGGGSPRGALQAYSVQNLGFWLILAGVLLYWLPPASWQNTIRYLAILYSVGLVESVQRALLDGPVLTLIAIGVLLAERKKPWLSAIVLSLAGLGKETSILAASLFGFPNLTQPKQAILLALKLVIVVLPLALWIYYLSFVEHSVETNSLGSPHNFDWPFFGWWEAVESLGAAIENGQPWISSVTTAAFLVALPVQVIAVLVLRQTSNLWWRVGSTFAVFSLIIGYATWEGVVGSAARVCLPVTMAFNLLAPRTTRWLLVLILGNLLSVLGFHAVIVKLPPQQFLTEPFVQAVSAGYHLEWKEGWYPTESDNKTHWRWSSGVATLDIRLADPRFSHAVLRFKARAAKPMEVLVSNAEGPLLTFVCGEYQSQEIEVVVPLGPGLNTLTFYPNTPALNVPGDVRPLSFMLINPALRSK